VNCRGPGTEGKLPSHARTIQQDPGDIDVWAEYLVVLDIVGIKQGRTREQVRQSLRDIDPDCLNTAIARLVAAGVIELRGDTGVQTAALDRLDRLDMICI
jgi:hypothetical protein